MARTYSLPTTRPEETLAALPDNHAARCVVGLRLAGAPERRTKLFLARASRRAGEERQVRSVRVRLAASSSRPAIPVQFADSERSRE